MWEDVRRAAASIGAPALAALALTPAPAAAREAAPAPPEPFGISGGTLLLPGAGVPRTADHVAAIGRSGLGSVRIIAVWNAVEPTAPEQATGRHRFDWSTTDATASLLARNGLRWDVILGLSNAWGGGVLGVFGPPRVEPFVEYAAAVARRYGRRGTFWQERPDLPYAPVTSYQVYNEPNLDGNWLPGADPSAYAQLYEATRTALLAVDPNARVATGALAHSAPDGAGGASEFVRAMLAARPSLAGNIDALGLTVYRPTPDAVLDQIADARRTLDALGETRTPIDISETGWMTQGFVPLADVTPVSESTRAGHLADLVRLLAAADCGIGTVTPYAWVTQENNPLDGSAWFGLADPGSAVLKPSGTAYAKAATAAADPGAAGGRCGRPDLPRLLQGRPRAREPFAVSLRRACSRRRMTIRTTLGTEPEPYSRFAFALPGGARRTSTDPDAGGPLTVRTTREMRMPRHRGEISVTALDELGRERASARARLRACPPRRR